MIGKWVLRGWKNSLPWLIPMLILLFWFSVSESGLVPLYLLPHPLQVLQAAHNYLFGHVGDAPYAGRFADDFSASFIRVLYGFGLATIIGLPLGLMSGRLSLVQRLLGTTINGVRAVPGISLLPLALVWFGIGLKTTVFLIALAAFFPIYLNAEAGARQVNPILLHAGNMLGLGRMGCIFSVLVPAAMPHIVAGLRLAMGISWAYLVLGELTGVPNGLGAVIMDARMLGRIDIIIVGIILIAVIGRLCDTGLYLALRLCCRSVRRMS